MTVTFDTHLELGLVSQRESAYQISRSKVIWFKSYCQDTQTHAHTGGLLYLDH